MHLTTWRTSHHLQRCASATRRAAATTSATSGASLASLALPSAATYGGSVSTTTLTCSSVGTDCSSSVDVCNSAGQFCDTTNAVGSGVNTCQNAQAGYYATGDGTQLMCPAKSTSGTGSHLCFCEAGFYGAPHSSGCEACSAGYYKAGTGAECNGVCALGYTTAATGQTSNTCTVCAIGFYSASGNGSGVEAGCEACSIGYVTTSPGTVGSDASVCDVCDVGYSGASSGGTSGCSQCDAATPYTGTEAGNNRTCVALSCGMVPSSGELTIPSYITAIPHYSFYGCYNLQSITFEIRSQLETIGQSAFATTGLTSFIAPASLTAIGDMAFEWNYYLTSVIFPCDASPLLVISPYAFGFDMVYSIALPSTVTYENYGYVQITELLCTDAPSAAPTEAPSQPPSEAPSAALPLTPAPGDDAPSEIQCSAGMYIKNKCKGHDEEWCEKCQAGKFNKNDNSRNRRCKKCPKDTFQIQKGAADCVKCPPGFHSRNSRGKRQCFERSSGKSMKKLGYFDNA